MRVEAYLRLPCACRVQVLAIESGRIHTELTLSFFGPLLFEI